MPDLHTPVHLNMLKHFKAIAEKNAIPEEFIYALHWGDPENVSPLIYVRQKYIFPYVNSDDDAVEIGPGGGRWTRYLLPFKKLYAVDYHAELLEELKKNFDHPNMSFINNNGVDFPGIADSSINYIFSFDVFVHLDTNLIGEYLKHIKRIAKPGANIIIHYSDKNKVMAQIGPTFSQNTPDQMRKLVLDAGFEILGEDLTTMWHSSIIHFTH